MKGKKLRRSRKNRMVSGVIGGIAEFFDVDPTLLRILFVIVTWSGFPIVLYLLLTIIIPEDTSTKEHHRSARYYYSTTRPRKEARKVEKDEEDWSDF